RGQDLLALARAAMKSTPPGHHAIDLLAIRSDDDSGVAIKLDFPAQPDENPQTLSIRVNVMVGNASIHNSAGDAFAQYLAEPNYYGDFERTVNKALDSAPNIELQIHLRLGGED